MAELTHTEEWLKARLVQLDREAEDIRRMFTKAPPGRLTDIRIRVVPHESQRYATVGDWQILDEGRVLQIDVSKMPDNRHEMLVAVHELIEVLICRQNGVTQEAVDAFDIAFEDARISRDDLSEPGDDPTAPYAMEHCRATAVERALCADLGCSWKAYEDEVNAL